MAETIPVEGNLDLKGNQIKNVAIEVVTSLPTTNNFVGRQVTYQGRSYIWNGSVWTNSLKGNGTINYLTKYINLDTLGNSGFYEENGLLFGNIPLGPNLINNSWMNRVASNGSPEGFIPATPMSGASLITQAVSPLTKGFEGCYLPSFDSSYMVSDAELATETNPMWYGRYYTGLRTTLGGLRNGWGSFGGGNIMKVLGSNFTKGSPQIYMGSFITMKTDANQMGTKWIFSCWVKLVKGERFAVGGDAGYYTVGPYPNSVSKTITDASPQGWYLHKVVVETSQISNISYQIMALAFEPDDTGEIEAYIALPYLAISNTKGDGNHSWTNSVLDRLWDKGIKVDLINKNVSFDNSVTSNETINYDLSAEPNETGTKTKTSTTLWQNLFAHINFLWLKLKDLFPTTQVTTHNYIPKIDNANKKLVKSNIQDDGTTPKYGANTIWHSGNDGSNSGLDADLLDGKHASDFVTSVTKAMVEAVLTGNITSHEHNYTTSTDVSNLINTAIASVYKPKGNIANKTALLALTNVKQGDVYNAQSAFTLNGQNVKIGDNIVCLANAATSAEANWDNLGGNIDFAAALSQALIGFSATSGNITSSDTILSAINKLAYDKHIHSNLNVLDLTTAAFTTALKNNYDTAYTHSQSTHAPTDALPNRTIKVEGIDNAGSATTIPLNFKSGDGIINIEGKVNRGILDIIFSSVNTLVIYGALDPQDLRDAKTGVHELIEGNLYSFTPNPICGTDINSDSLFGKLIILENIDGISKNLYYHSYKTNKIHVCSGYDNGSIFVWNNWERLLTCKDETNVVIGVEGVYSYTIDRGDTEINVDLNFNPKSDIIEIDVSSFKDTVIALIGFNVIFSTPITGGVTVVINNGTSKTIKYTQFYQNPSFYTGAMFEIQYRIWNRYSDWLYHNRII